MLIKGETETLKIYNSSVRSNFNAGNMSFSDELTVHVHIQHVYKAFEVKFK